MAQSLRVVYSGNAPKECVGVPTARTMFEKSKGIMRRVESVVAILLDILQRVVEYND